MSPEVGNLVLNDEVEFGLATLPVKHRDLVGEVLFARRDVLFARPITRWRRDGASVLRKS